MSDEVAKWRYLATRRPLRPYLTGKCTPTGLALATLLLASACDGAKFAERLQAVTSRQSGRGERLAERMAEKASHGRTGLPDAIVEALDLIAESDAEFIVKKTKNKDRTYSGFDFAAMLTTKTIWLGRGIDDFDLWIKEIASGSFVNREDYEVRRPDGVTEVFSSWIVRQIASRPRSAEERAAEERAQAQADAKLNNKSTKRR